MCIDVPIVMYKMYCHGFKILLHNMLMQLDYLISCRLLSPTKIFLVYSPTPQVLRLPFDLSLLMEDDEGTFHA